MLQKLSRGLAADIQGGPIATAPEAVPAPVEVQPALGVERIELADLVPFIDWSPFFHTWEMRGRYPEILQNSEAKKLFDDAQELLRKIASNSWLQARAVKS